MAVEPFFSYPSDDYLDEDEEIWITEQSQFHGTVAVITSVGLTAITEDELNVLMERWKGMGFGGVAVEQPDKERKWFLFKPQLRIDTPPIGADDPETAMVNRHVRHGL